MSNQHDEGELGRSGREDELSEFSEQIPEAMKSFFSFFAGRPVFPPFVERINEEHITKVLDYSERQDERDFKDTLSDRRYKFGYFIVGCIVAVFLFTFLTIYLADKDKELYKDIVKIVIGFVSGSLFGYGLGKIRKDE
jgi:hypothetical protein